MLLGDDRVVVERVDDFLYFDALWLAVVGGYDYACVDFAFAEWHNNSTASHDSALHGCGDEVCEAVEWQWQYDVCVCQVLCAVVVAVFLEEVCEGNLVCVVFEFSLYGIGAYAPYACFGCVAHADVVVIAYAHVAECCCSDADVPTEC